MQLPNQVYRLTNKIKHSSYPIKDNNKDSKMSLYTITAKLHLPTDYNLPEACDINIKIVNTTTTSTPSTLGVWGTNQCPAEFPWSFTFNIDSDTTEVGDKYSMHVNMKHESTNLLLDIEHTFRWGGGNQEIDIHLSPVGYISVRKTFMPMIDFPVDSKLTVKLSEKAIDRESEIVANEGSTLTASTQPFYVRYNPQDIKPGQRYRLSGLFEIHNGKHLALGLHPRELVLLPEKIQGLPFGV
jgi:hypothetical protein